MASKRSREKKSQNAMEFLLTYGWMLIVLTIMVVLIFQFGASVPINPSKAIPGACQVYRPGGPFITTNLALEGACNNLAPKYVAVLSQTNGGHVIIPLQQALSSNVVTMTFWLELTGKGQFPQNIVTVNGTYLGSPHAFDIYQQGDPGNTITPWQFIVLTINVSKQSGKNTFLYVNNTVVATDLFTPTSSNGMNVGGAISAYGLFGMDGQISNIQLYSAILSQGDMQELFVEGIGGDPIQLQQLQGWWPLNGDSVDYSGNGRNGQGIAGLSFAGQLTQNYTVP